jgi:SAM-dependent methyltransferase
MPWDFGGVPVALEDFLRRQSPGRVLIPGCGSAYEVRAFVRAGWFVDAVDFSSEAVQRARALLGEEGADRVRQGDFYAGSPHGPFDLVYERTFLCAFPPQRWPAYAAQIRQSLRPGGLLAGFFFHGPEPEPPPYPLPVGGAGDVLGSGFERIEDTPVEDSLPFFAGRERWQVWRFSPTLMNH